MMNHFCECESGPCATRTGHRECHCQSVNGLQKFSALGFRITLCVDCAEYFHAYVGEIEPVKEPASCLS
jgi:hypothetical protein